MRFTQENYTKSETTHPPRQVSVTFSPDLADTEAGGQSTCVTGVTLGGHRGRTTSGKVTGPSIAPGKGEALGTPGLLSACTAPHGDPSPPQPQAPAPHTGTLPHCGPRHLHHTPAFRPTSPQPHTGPLLHSCPSHFHPTWQPLLSASPGTRTPLQGSDCAPGCAAGPARPTPGSHRAAPIPAGVCRARPPPRLLLAASAPPLRRDHNSQRAARPRYGRQPIRSVAAVTASSRGHGGGARVTSRAARRIAAGRQRGAAGRGRCGALPQ